MWCAFGVAGPAGSHVQLLTGRGLWPHPSGGLGDSESGSSVMESMLILFLMCNRWSLQQTRESELWDDG